MSNFSERAGVRDVPGVINRASELFPGVAPSTAALWLLATRAGRMTEAFTREVLADLGLDNSDFSILVVLLLNPSPHRTAMRDLESAVVLSQSGTTRALQRCERSGHVRKLPDTNDGRAMIVELTDAGRLVAEATMATLLARFEERLGASFSVAQAHAAAATNAQYAVALDKE